MTTLFLIYNAFNAFHYLIIELSLKIKKYFMILIFKGYNNLSYLNSVDDLLNQQKQVKREMNERERERDICISIFKK